MLAGTVHFVGRIAGMEFPYHCSDYRTIRETKAVHSIIAKEGNNIFISQFLL